MFDRLISVFKTPVIEFMCEERYYGVIPEPIPAKKALPSWFKSIPGYMENRDSQTWQRGMTAKKCLPMIDAMSVGFIMPLFADQVIKSNHDCSVIEIGPTSTMFPKVIERHGIEQVGNNTALFKTDPIKFINPWIIKTAPGWSTLFVPCLNQLETRFTVLSGLVDTDKYPKQVNFPGTWNVPDFYDVLPAGTPLITAIPMRRSEIITKAPVRAMNEKDHRVWNRIHMSQQSRKHHYTHELREKR